MATFSKGAGYSKADLKTSGKPIILYGRMYTKYETIIRNVDTFAEEKAGSVYSESGDVIVPASGETAQDISRASVVANSGILLGGDINIIHPNNELNPGFLALTISNGNQQKKLSMKAQGATIVHLHNEDLKGVDILCPSIDEQTLISEFFERIDNTITLHQRKLESIKLLKKSLLQKMFPKSGETVPEVRFPGFTDAWEQRKLGDLADIVGGGTPSTSKGEYWDGDIDWYAPAEIADQIYVSSSQKKITQAGYDNSSAKMLPVGTVLFTRRAGIGKTAILAKKGCTNQGFQSIVPHEGQLDSYFIFSRTDELKKYGETTGAGSTFVEVSGKQMARMELLMPPTISEQREIGRFFASMDSTITLHQRKLESIKLLKKSLLQKMFPKSGETVPEVRFPGFTDAWEQRKLGDIVERITRKNTNNESDLPLTISAQYGLIDQNEFFDKRIASKDVSGDYLVKNGEFAYNKSTSNDAPWGAVKRLDRYKNGVVSTLYIVFSIRDSNTTDSDFLATYYDTDRWHSGIQAVAAEGARNHGLLNISASDFFNTTLKMPADIEEQRKIGAFFKEIDNTITLHQREP